MNLARKIAYNTIISAGARMIGVALSLVGIGFIARYLGQEGFGNYSLILAFLYTFNILADLGLYSLMTRDISRPGANEEKIANNIFTIRVVASIFFVGLAALLVWFFPYGLQVKIGVAIASLAFLFSSSSQVLMGIFQKRLRMEQPSIAELVGRLVQLVLFIFIVQTDLGFFPILIAFVFSSFLIFLIDIIFVRKYIKLKLSFDLGFWKKIFKSTFPIAVSIILTLIYFKIDTIFLSLPIINRASANPIADVGVYNIAYKVLEGLIFFPAMFVGLIMPLLSKFAFSNQDQFKKIFQKGLDVLIIFIIPLVIALLFLSLPVVVLIGGKAFTDSALVLQVLSVAIGLIFLGNLFGHSIIALNKQKIGAWIYFSGMIFNVIANLIFIPKYSYIGAAITTVFTEFLVTVLMFILIWKTISYFPSFKISFKAIFAGLTMGGVIYYLQNWNLFLLVGLGLVVYFGMLYLIKGISKEEVLMLVRR